MTDGPYLSPPLDIEDRFLDYNGHVNMAYFLVLADQALDLAFAPIKGDDYIARRGMTTFAAEVHIRYLCEINRDDDIRGRVRFVGTDEKRARWAVELVRAPDMEIVSTIEGVSLSVGVDSRKVVPFPTDVLERLRTAAGRNADDTDLSWLGRAVGMKK